LTPRENDEFGARQALDADISIILAAVDANPALRERFGGVAIDNETGELAVMLKDGAPKGWLADVPHPDRISIRHADLSETELLALKKSITAAWETGEAGTGPITGVGLDTLENAIQVDFLPEVVGSLKAGEFPAAFEARFDTTYLRPGSSPGAVGLAEDHVKGGWSWGHSSSGYRCTIGFAVVKSGASNDHEFAITAGHCIHPNENWDAVYHNYGGSTPPEGEIGLITSDHTFSASADMDAGLLRIDADDPDFFSEARVVHKSAGTPYALSVIGKVDSHVQGKPRCHTGKGSGTTICGTVEASSYDAMYGVDGVYASRIIEDTVRVDGFSGIIGDSGGPAYYKRTSEMTQPNTVQAAGLYVATSGTDGVYVKIQKALDWISDSAGVTVSIKKWDNAPGCEDIQDCQEDDGGDY
jgi:hypothetical protein